MSCRGKRTGTAVLYHNVQVMAYSLRFVDAGAAVAAAAVAIWYSIEGGAQAR